MSGSTGAIRAGRAFVELFADNTRLQAGLKLAEKSVKEFGERVSTIGRQVATAGGLAAAPMALATKIFAGFDDQMRAVQGVTGATGEGFDRLTEKAKFLGRTTSFTAAQVASGMLELGRAGFKTDEIDAAIAHVMNLSRSTQTEIPLATEIAGNALRGFALDADQMGRVSDVLATTANNSSQTLEDLGEAFKYVAPIANEAGMSLEETSKVLGTLANFGIKGSMAGTTVKNILSRMADPDVQAKYEELGVKVTDVSGKLRNMSDVLLDVGQATSSLPNAERLAIFKELFDMRAMAGGAKLTGAGFKEMFDAIDNAAGTSERVAQQMDAGIGGAFRMFISAAEGMAIAIGNSLAPEIKKVSDNLTESQTKITEWINEHKAAIISCAQLAAKAILVGGSLYLIGKAATAVSATIGIFRSSMIAVRAVLGLLLTDVTKIGKVFSNLAGMFKPIESVNANVDVKSTTTVQALSASAASASASVTELNGALNIMRTTLAACTQTITTFLTPLEQLLVTARTIPVLFTRGAKSAGAFHHSLLPLAKTITATATASGRLATTGNAIGRAYVGTTGKIENNTLALRENLSVTKTVAASIRSVRTATASAAKSFTIYTAAIKANTKAMEKNVAAGGVAPNAYFQNAAAVKTETAALAENDAVRTANATQTAESTSARTASAASITAETVATESNTAAHLSETAAVAGATEATASHTAAQKSAATSETILATSMDASAVSAASEATSLSACSVSAETNAAAHAEEAATYALCASAADANSISVAGNTALTDSNTLSVTADTRSLAGNTIALTGNSTAITQNTAAIAANDVAVKTLVTDSVAASGVFTRLGTAIKSTFTAKTGGFLALSNQQAFTATGQAMSRVWSSASGIIVTSFQTMKNAAASSLTGIASVMTQTSVAVRGFSMAQTLAAAKTVLMTAIQKTCTAVMGMSRAVYMSAAVVLGVFSTANTAAAAGIVKVTTVSVAAKSAVAAYGVAATVTAGATRALSAAMSLICAHPVTATLAALSAIVAGLCIYLKDAGKYTAQLTDEMSKLAEAGDKTRSLDQTKMEGIGKLGAKSLTGSLDDKEFTQGKKWVEELTGRYGDLGIQIDDVNKKIILATDSQKKFIDAMNAKALQDKDSVIKEEENNLAELEKEQKATMDRMEGWSGRAAASARKTGQILTFGYVDSAYEAWPKQMEEQNNKIIEQRKKLSELRKERAALAEGDETIATGGSVEDSVNNSVADIGETENTPFNLSEFEASLRGTEVKTADELNELEANYQKGIAEINAQLEKAQTPEEKKSAQDRLNHLQNLYTSKKKELTENLPENKTQTDFWSKMKESGQSEEEKEIGQLNEDLTAVLDAIQTSVHNKTITPEEAATQSQAAKDATSKAIAKVRAKYKKERDAKLRDSAIDPADEELIDAAQTRDAKLNALHEAKTGGNIDVLRRAQTEYDAAQLAYEGNERDKFRTRRETSGQNMTDALADYHSAGDDVGKREDAKRRYDDAKSKNDAAASYFAEPGADWDLNYHNRLAQNNLAQKSIDLQDAYKTKDKRKIAAAKKEYDTAFTKAQNTQTQQSLATSSQTANQTLAAAIADRDQKQANLNQAQFFGDSDRMEQAQSEYDESDYAVRQAEYQKALSDAQNSAYEMSEAQKNYKDALKSGTPEEKKVAKERLNEAKENRNDAFAALSGLQPQETRQLLSDVSRDYSSEDEAKPERTTTTKGTFSAFESLGQSFDWQRSNGEKQLDELTKIRENLENQDDGYI